MMYDTNELYIELDKVMSDTIIYGTGLLLVSMTVDNKLKFSNIKPEEFKSIAEHYENNIVKELE